MNIPNKAEIQQIAFINSADIEWKDFINLYKKCTAKSYSCLFIDATRASGNPSLFRNDNCMMIEKK